MARCCSHPCMRTCTPRSASTLHPEDNCEQCCIAAIRSRSRFLRPGKSLQLKNAVAISDGFCLAGETHRRQQYAAAQWGGAAHRKGTVSGAFACRVVQRAIQSSRYVPLIHSKQQASVFRKQPADATASTEVRCNPATGLSSRTLTNSLLFLCSPFSWQPPSPHYFSQVQR